MAIVPGESIREFAALKPTSFAVWCLLCDVRQKDSPDAYLELTKAESVGIKKSAYFHAFNELEEKGWIHYSRRSDGKKWWKLVKGFAQNSANVEFQDETPVENSTNVEYSTNAESTNAENSANVESHIRNIVPLEEPQETNVSFGTEQTRSKKTRIPLNFALSTEMALWARENVPEIDALAATEDFYEYWSNVEGKKGEKVDWVATWKKGMRLQKKWQSEPKQKGENNGKYSNSNGKKSNGEIYNEWGNLVADAFG